MDGGAVLVVRAAAIQGEFQGGSVCVEIEHEGRTGADRTRTTTCDGSPSWNHTLTLPLENLNEGHVKVSLWPGAPPTEEELAELAFDGKQPPPPLGFVRVPVADLSGLERSRPFTLEGADGGGPGSITLGFTVVEDDGAAEEETGVAGQRSMSGIFSTSDLSVDPPLPLRSSTQSDAFPMEEGFGGKGGKRDDSEEQEEAVEEKEQAAEETEERNAIDAWREVRSGGRPQDGSSPGRGEGHIQPRGGASSEDGQVESTSSDETDVSSQRHPGGGGQGFRGGRVTRGAEGRGDGGNGEGGDSSSGQSSLSGDDGGRRRDRRGISGGGVGVAPTSLGAWRRDSDDDDVHFTEDYPAEGSERHRDGNTPTGAARGTHGGFGGTDDSSSFMSESITALLCAGKEQAKVIADEKGGQTGGTRRVCGDNIPRKTHPRTGASPGGALGGGDGGGGSTGGSSGGSRRNRPSLFLGSSSSSNFEFSSAQPVSTVGDLWGSSGGAELSIDRRGAGGVGGAGRYMDTPQREAAVRLEALTATVAAAVAEVAAETYDESNQQDFFNTSSVATGGVLDTSSADDDVDDDDIDGGGRIPVGGLPLVGARSPRAATGAAHTAARPGRREPNSDVDECHQYPRSAPHGSSTGDSSSAGFAGGLPLAASRSPPARRVPSRPDPDSSGADSSDVRRSVAAAAAKSKPSRRGEGRRQRRSLERVRRGATDNPTMAGATATASKPSVATSAPLDLSSPDAWATPHPTGASGGGGEAGGLRRRGADHSRPEDTISRSRGRSEVSWWEKEHSTGDDDEELSGISGTGRLDTGDTPGGGFRRSKQRLPPSLPHARQNTGALHRSTRRHHVGRIGPPRPAAAVAVVTTPGNVSRRGRGVRQRPAVVWPQVTGGKWAGGKKTVVGGAAAAAAAAAVVPEEPEPVSGLRATHFAPGFVGVAWPDPLEAGVGARHLVIAREKLLKKLEEASARKIADVEERSLRARRERTERLKRRNLLAEQQFRREIRDAMAKQERRLERQLEAARRRQAGAEAAAAVAAAAAAAKVPLAREAGAATIAAAVARERAEAVRRRRALLEADQARARIYAFKRKGELRTQALLRGVVRSAVGDEDIAAAAEAFESAAEGFGLDAAALSVKRTGAKGAVIASGAPRSTWESWNEQRRSKAEEIRLQGAVEKAFKTLHGAAALRRENAVDARRDRAREINAKADEGHGRACKRLRMQAETAAARLEARAREAAAAAAAAEAEAARRERDRRVREIKARKQQQQQQQQQQHRAQTRVRWREPRTGRRRRGEPSRDRDGRSPGKAGGGYPSLVEVLGEVKTLVDHAGDGDDDEVDDASLESGGGGGEGAGRQLPGNISGGGGSQAGSRALSAAKDGGQPETAWAEEDRVVARRLEHLDAVAARLEEAGAEIEANIDLLGWEHGRPRTAIDSTDGRSDGGTPADGYLGRDSFGGDGGTRGRRRQQRRGDEVVGHPARRSSGTAPGGSSGCGGGKGKAGTVASRRLVAPTISSKNKAQRQVFATTTTTAAPTRGRGAARSGCPRLLARSGDRKTQQAPAEDGVYRPLGGRGWLAAERSLSGGDEGVINEKCYPRARQGCRRRASGEKSGRGLSTAGRRGSPDRMLSCRNDGDDDDDDNGRYSADDARVGNVGGSDRQSGEGEVPGRGQGQSRRLTRLHEGLEEKEGRDEEMQASGRMGHTLSVSSSFTLVEEADEKDKGHGLLCESRRGRERYRAEHKEVMESVSSDAMRMRAIKDDLSAVLRRLREGDVSSLAAAGSQATAAAGTPVARRPLLAGGVAGHEDAGEEARKEKGQQENEEEELAAALYGTSGRQKRVNLSAPTPTEDRRRRGRASSGAQITERSAFSPLAVPGDTTGNSMTLQVSALADLEARIASLGGLLNSFSSEDGDGQLSARRHSRHHRLESSGVGEDEAWSTMLRPPSSSPPPLTTPAVPPPERRQQARPRSRSPVPLTLMHVNNTPSSFSCSTSSGSKSPRYSADGGARSLPGSSVPAYWMSEAGGEEGGGDSEAMSIAAEAVGLSGAASDLAREVDALLRASGSGSGGGESRNSVAAEATTPVGSGLEEKTESSSPGLGELEGMANRLEALSA